MYFPRAISALLPCASASDVTLAPASVATIARIALWRNARGTAGMVGIITDGNNRRFPGSGSGLDLAPLEVSLHDERVLAGIVVIPTAAPHDAKPERFVQSARLIVGWADLESHGSQAPRAPVIEDRPKQLSC